MEQVRPQSFHARLPWSWFWVFVLIAGLGSSCDSIARLRRLVRGEGAGLRVDVTPDFGIDILVDGRSVAQRSPYVTTTLSGGAHVLEIRADGYHSVTLPFDLGAGEKLSVPVALRRAPHTPRPTAEKPEVKTAAPRPPPAPALPPGVNPIVLTFQAVPATTLTVDDVPVDGTILRLDRIHGAIAASGIKLTYRLGGAGLLELTLSSEQAAWTRDGQVMLPGNSFRLMRGATRLTRIAPDGSAQTLLLKH